MKRGKKYLEKVKLVDSSVQYDAKDAVELVGKTAVAKFDETVECRVLRARAPALRLHGAKDRILFRKRRGPRKPRAGVRLLPVAFPSS